MNWVYVILVAAIFVLFAIFIVKRKRMMEFYSEHINTRNQTVYDFDSLTFRRSTEPEPDVKLYDDHVQCEVKNTLKRLKTKNKIAYDKTLDLIKVVPQEHLMAVMDAINSMDKEENDNDLYDTNDFEFKEGNQTEAENLYEELNIVQEKALVHAQPETYDTMYSTISKEDYQQEINDIYADPRDSEVNIDDAEVIDILEENVEDLYAEPVKCMWNIELKSYLVIKYI